MIPHRRTSAVQKTKYAPLHDATHATCHVRAGGSAYVRIAQGDAPAHARGRARRRRSGRRRPHQSGCQCTRAARRTPARPAGHQNQAVIRSQSGGHHRALTHASPRLLSVPLAQDDAPLSLRVPCPVMLAHAAAIVAADCTVVAIRDRGGESFGRCGARRRPVGRRDQATPAWPERLGRLVTWLRLAVGAWLGGRCAIRRGRSERDARRVPRAQAGQAWVQVGRAGGTLAVVRLHVDGVLFPRELD